MISVLIPALNEEKYIGTALEALLKQKNVEFEVIVIDNGSTDKTQEVVKKFPVILLEEKRKGTMWACEKGRSVAKGDIIVRMDADCVPDADWLTKGAKHFENTHVSGASGPYYFYDTNLVSAKVSLLFQQLIYAPMNKIVQLYKKGALSNGGNTFMRASALASAGGFNTNLVFYGDDTDTAKRMSKYGTFVFDNKLILKTSARRLKSEGAIKITIKYIFYFLKGTFYLS